MARILVIDDEIFIRQLLTEILENAGYEVVTAPEGRTGLTLYEQSPFDVVITDMVMPEYSGINTINDLVRKHPDAKIIAISGGGEIEPERYLTIAEIIGAQYIIYKPFKKEEILKAVEGLLS
jgi:DNA-binding NtrC family response regulator